MSSCTDLRPLFLIKKILQEKNNPKNETSKVKENILILISVLRIDARLFVGKKPPEETTVKAKFRELKDLISKIL